MFTNTSSHKTFFSGAALKKGDYYPKNVKLIYSKYNAFGIDAEMYDTEIRDSKLGVIFVVKNDIEDYYQSMRKNKKVIACEKGRYLATNETIAQFGKREIANAKFGEQIFVPIFKCQILED